MEVLTLESKTLLLKIKQIDSTLLVECFSRASTFKSPMALIIYNWLLGDRQTDMLLFLERLKLMNTGADKFAQTQPIAETNDADRIDREAGLEMNDVDKLGKEAGLEMSDREELGLKGKLDERDDSRLDLNNDSQTLAD